MAVYEDTHKVHFSEGKRSVMLLLLSTDRKNVNNVHGVAMSSFHCVNYPPSPPNSHTKTVR